VTITVTWRDATSFDEQSTAVSLPWSELLAADRALLWKGEAVFDYALALKARKANPVSSEEYLAAYASWLAAQEMAEELNPGDVDLAELRAVMNAL
jgi:hypothetical protein